MNLYPYLHLYLYPLQFGPQKREHNFDNHPYGGRDLLYGPWGMFGGDLDDTKLTPLGYAVLTVAAPVAALCSWKLFRVYVCVCIYVWVFSCALYLGVYSYIYIYICGVYMFIHISVGVCVCACLRPCLVYCVVLFSSPKGPKYH